MRPRFCTTRFAWTLAGVTLFVLLVAAATPAATASSKASTARRDVVAFRGLGAWVDAYDYAPAFQEAGGLPSVTASAVKDMAALGVKTLYLQAAKDDVRSPGSIVDRRIVGELLRAAHANGIRVVAWYLPKFADLAADRSKIRALHRFRSKGERFDALAIDIEWTSGVPDVAVRNARLIELSAWARGLVGRQALGAIVYPPVQLEVVNPTLWPTFPWEDLASIYDVWMPMSYWTFRSPPYRDAYTYVEESTRRLRANLGKPRAIVHDVGGLAEDSSRVDLEGFGRAVRKNRSIGWSIYDFDTTRSSHWEWLRPTKES